MTLVDVAKHAALTALQGDSHSGVALEEVRAKQRFHLRAKTTKDEDVPLGEKIEAVS
jgi:hypothetical protein